MLKITTTAAVLAAALSAPAFAGSVDPAPMEPVVPAPAPAPQWQGGYAGVELGYASVDESPGANDDGVIGGFIAGYDWQSGSTVYGLGLDIDATGVTVGGTDVDHIGRLKGRIGQATGNGLIYATAGAARMKTSAGGTSATDNGWFAGVGYETFVAQNTTVGGELLYHDFSNFDGGGVDLSATTLQVRVAFRF
ncbi:MAG: porin family protein [Sediminimonas qiaohouensis]|uniref:Porin family protein n=1 Tax=Sediminimonas qiaohouensis TaxID=552061 RepID=A0A7C9HNH5_9RHOB|nr:outer membrane beta-barrel protein [Sediminimonas qiaohouensis]MTJ05063.1 porin family protein [Sediminimonas qiaohouensis]